MYVLIYNQIEVSHVSNGDIGPPIMLSIDLERLAYFEHAVYSLSPSLRYIFGLYMYPLIVRRC